MPPRRMTSNPQRRSLVKKSRPPKTQKRQFSKKVQNSRKKQKGGDKAKTTKKSKTTVKKRTVRKTGKKTGGKKAMTTLDQLNAISWDVLQLPERAMWKGKTAAENRLILEKVIHKGSIRLLLPVVRNTSEDNGKQMVVYSVIVKGRENLDRDIRFGDILHKIHGFYMGTKVSDDDIAYASMGDASVPIGRKADQIRFGNFIEGQTKFGGLQDQGNGTYVLSLT